MKIGDWAGLLLSLAFIALSIVSVLLDKLWCSLVILPFQIVLATLVVRRVWNRDSV